MKAKASTITMIALWAPSTGAQGIRGFIRGFRLLESSTLNTVGWNPNTLRDVRDLLSGCSTLPDWAKKAKDKLADLAADKVSLPGTRPGVGSGPWHVGGQGPDSIAANATSRDYHTVSGYYWPCNATCPNRAFYNCSGWDQSLHAKVADKCDNASGIPWIKHDGFLRDENLEDLHAMVDMMDAAETLTLAWWFLPEHDASYAEKAVEVLRTWFWDEESGMNPALEYGAAIPGVYNGTAGALIAPSFRLGTRLSDCVEILKTADDSIWTEDDEEGWSDWSGKWSRWMRDSEFGRHELGAVGNHATFLFSHKLALATATEDDDLVLDVVAGLRTDLAGSLAEQILPFGEMPVETARPTSATYSLMNLNGLFLLGEAVENACRDLSCSPAWDWSWEVTGTTVSRWEPYEDAIAGCRWRESVEKPPSVESCKATCLAREEEDCNAVVVRERSNAIMACYLQGCAGTVYDHTSQTPATKSLHNNWTSYHYVEGPQVGSGSVRKALDFVLPYATGSESWTKEFPDAIDGSTSWSWRTLALPLRIAANKYGNSTYESDIATVDPFNWFSNHTFNSLLFPPLGGL